MTLWTNPEQSEFVRSEAPYRAFSADNSAESGLDPMEITNPASAYLFLSDDAQDEITGTDKKKM